MLSLDSDDDPMPEEGGGAAAAMGGVEVARPRAVRAAPPSLLLLLGGRADGTPSRERLRRAELMMFVLRWGGDVRVREAQKV